MSQLESKHSDLALLLLRVGVGIIFIYAGWGKLTGIEGTQEFFGGIMVLFGAYAKIPYLLLAIVMLVALFTTKLGGEFPAARLDLMLLLTNLALFLLGSGRFSVDYKIANR